ncbi:MAG: MoaD/ThiS family protein [Actinobacteria bacterium]|jgi:molybdopterin converting factor small subunit|nr:MoaD/ThiS family protein [Actinomycetota bacterium]MCL6105489.1 MoaD/ThiS family protein [Actinomycetota bacterium]
MSVDVRLPTVLRQHAAGQSIVTIQGSTVGEVLSKLVKEYPAMADQIFSSSSDRSLHRFINVYLNDDDVRYIDNLDTVVKENDVISILPAVAGGEHR